LAINVLELYFLPPLALARLGGSDTPLECFHWAPGVGTHSANQTTIEPAATLEIDGDGRPSAYLPQNIRFRDAGKLRPVAPFFELWIRTQDQGQAIEDKPVTLDLLEHLGLAVSDLRFRVTVGNKKAQRRTQSPSCSFIARADVRGDDHTAKPLLAYSPTDPDHDPLVRKDAPIPLGTFQIVRPERGTSHKIDLSVIRVRFTPAKGEVYGPPAAVASISSPLPEGEELPWDKLMQGRMHEIVKPENRILNGSSLWAKFRLLAPGHSDPVPYDTYDGAASGDQRSWGVVDDTCDGIVECHLVVRAQRFSAYARVISCVPDYAPDRRPFASIAEDLADRSLPPAPVDQATLDITEDEIVDLFHRIFETASLINLDAERYKFAGQQDPTANPPHTDLQSMTGRDGDYAVHSATGLIDQEQAIHGAAFPRSKLQYTDLARQVHAGLTETQTLLDFLHTNADRLRRLVRPPFGRFRQLSETFDPPQNEDFRDPRVDRDRRHDMRMPPYMRDSDATPLSLSWRQYDALMRLLDVMHPPIQPAVAAAPPPPPRIHRRVAEVLARLRTERNER
jgi:hypothetical protein